MHDISFLHASECIIASSLSTCSLDRYESLPARCTACQSNVTCLGLGTRWLVTQSACSSVCVLSASAARQSRTRSLTYAASLESNSYVGDSRRSFAFEFIDREHTFTHFLFAKLCTHTPSYTLALTSQIRSHPPTHAHAHTHFLSSYRSLPSIRDGSKQVITHKVLPTTLGSQQILQKKRKSGLCKLDKEEVLPASVFSGISTKCLQSRKMFDFCTASRSDPPQ